MRTQYPIVNEDNILSVVQEMVRLRQDEDVPDFTNLSSQFISGRKVTKIPSSSSDVSASDGDRENDFNWDASFLYILVDNSGALEWRRVGLSSF